MKKSIILALIATMAFSVIVTGCSTGKSSSSSSASEAKSSSSAEAKTDDSKTDDSTATAEKVVYDDNGLKITYIGMEKGAISQNVLFRIENNSNTDYIIQSEDADINDCALMPMFSVEVNKGKRATDDMSFLSSDLEKNQIEKIEKIEFTFKFLDPDTFETKFTSNPIIINP